MSTTPETAEGISLEALLLQFALLCLVFYLWSSPAILPVKLIVVLFHEMSHGLMALLTGGKVLSIIITADEGGACETEGGSEMLIVSAGYLGSMFVGGMILYLSRARQLAPLVYGMLSLTLVAAVVTVLRDDYSRTFASCLAGAFVFLGFILPATIGSITLRALGTFACIYSLFDIYWDILADRGGEIMVNDAVAFSRLTGVEPEMVGMAWMLAGVVFFLVVLRHALAQAPRSPGGGRGASPAAA